MGFCRKAVTAYEAGAKTYTPVLFWVRLWLAVLPLLLLVLLTQVMVRWEASLFPHRPRLVSYILRITVASSNAGAFELLNSNGSVIGTGNVASAFVGAGLAFTLADGSTDFIVGDTFVITVTGTESTRFWKTLHPDGSAAFAGIYIGASNGLGIDTSVAATTDTHCSDSGTWPGSGCQGRFDAWCVYQHCCRRLLCTLKWLLSASLLKLKSNNKEKLTWPWYARTLMLFKLLTALPKST